MIGICWRVPSDVSWIRPIKSSPLTHQLCSSSHLNWWYITYTPCRLLCNTGINQLGEQVYPNCYICLWLTLQIHAFLTSVIMNVTGMFHAQVLLHTGRPSTCCPKTRCMLWTWRLKEMRCTGLKISCFNTIMNNTPAIQSIVCYKADQATMAH